MIQNMQNNGPHFFFDFDSTLVTKESLDMVIESALAEAEHKDELVAKVNEITDLGMEGKLNFTNSLTERFAVVPFSRGHFEEVGEVLRAHITPGMTELFAEMAKEGVSAFIISGGFRESILPVAHELGVSEDRVFTNTVIYDAAGAVVGIDTENVCYTDEGKAPVIEHIKKTFDLAGEFVMVGDGANDLKSYELGAATDFCGFVANAKRDVIVERAPHVAHTTAELRAFIFSK